MWRVAARVGQLSFRTKLLAGTWLLFAMLVGSRLHGSSMALAAQIWAPDEAPTRYLASPILSRLRADVAERLRGPLMAKSRWERGDEWSHEILWSLAQFTHEPRFPVTNTNIGLGHNMLVLPWVPVWHASTIARPGTWGYFLTGRINGISWSWWFRPFFCFTALYLLLEIVFRERRSLALVGSLWYCLSAFTICWSNWPAYPIGYGAAMAAAAYHMLTSPRLAVRLLCGAGFGLAFAAWIMLLYPPWMIPVAWVILLLFAGLVVRDRLWTRDRVIPALPAFAVAGLCAAAALVPFFASTADALTTLAQTVYPGQRRLQGGDCNITRLFGAFYNVWTSKKAPTALENPCEAAGFYLFFPVVGLAALVSRRVRAKMDPVAWAMLALSIVFTIFGHFGFPRWLADITLLSRVQAFRAQIGLGLASIIVSLYPFLPARKNHAPDRYGAPVTLTVVLGTFLLFLLWQGIELQRFSQFVNTTSPVPLRVIFIPLLAAGGAALLLLARIKVFVGALVVTLVITAGSYNPLYVGMPSIERSELRRAVRDILARDQAVGRRSMWLTYGGNIMPYAGTLLSAMGARTLSGVHFVPQLDLWRRFDPQGREEDTYNRFSVITLLPVPLHTPVAIFLQPKHTSFNLMLSPLHPALRELEARYVVTLGPPFPPHLSGPPLRALYRGQTFTIWELPDSPTGSD